MPIRVVQKPVAVRSRKLLKEVMRLLGLERRPDERGGRGRGAEHLQRRPACDVLHQSVPWLRCRAMYSDVRIASARIVHVQFLCAFDTNGPPSATNTFRTSCAW